MSDMDIKSQLEIISRLRERVQNVSVDPRVKAIEKLKAEISQSEEKYVELVGNYLISYIEKRKDISVEGVLEASKSIVGSIEEMAKVAFENTVMKDSQKDGMDCTQGVGMLSDQEGYEIVLKYFGLMEV